MMARHQKKSGSTVFPPVLKYIQFFFGWQVLAGQYWYVVFVAHLVIFKRCPNLNGKLLPQ
jgi:hypothetical protein